jgi:ABC-type nickel/cobalt efflux system permease component RcnA
MKTKHLLNGVAVIAALALSAPVWAQPANPSGGNSMGMPGPSPGGPGLTPYSTGTPTGRGFGPKASGGNYVPPSATTEPSSTSAAPPKHHHAHAHHVVSTHQMLHAHGPKSGTDTTAQLNQAELARLQSGNFTPPPVPPGPEMAPPASDGMNRMPAGGRATSYPTGGR